MIISDYTFVSLVGEELAMKATSIHFVTVILILSLFVPIRIEGIRERSTGGDVKEIKRRSMLDNGLGRTPAMG